MYSGSSTSSSNDASASNPQSSQWSSSGNANQSSGSSSNSNQLSPTSDRPSQSSSGGSAGGSYNSSSGSAGGSYGAQQSGSSQSSQSGQFGAGSSSSGLNINVQGSSDSDRTLAQQITQQLRADSSLSSILPQVRISINNGKATVTGSVRSQQEKQQIESALQKVSGVTSVENQVQVSSSAANPRPQQ